MAEQDTPPIHPGIYTKVNLLPIGVSITKAAEMMGIGRPALSNFLNGKASLSQNMAARLRKAFLIDTHDLLKMQQNFDEFQNAPQISQISVKSYAPSFLKITARQIEDWADKNIEARAHLAILLRRLAMSSGSQILHIDFPAYDNSQKHGWDGQIESNNATPWVPIGISGWEFGCNINPTSKANGDYESRTKSIKSKERKETTFVFVTPRNWIHKETWVNEKKSENNWKDIIAFDASDIEQWLEQSIPAQVWLADKLGIPTEGLQALDDYWLSWSGVTEPKISPKIFDACISSNKDDLIKWINNEQIKPLIVAAASKEEAAAFIACAANAIDDLKKLSEEAVYVTNAKTLKKLSLLSNNVIPVALNQETELEITKNSDIQHSLIVTEKNLQGLEPDIIVDIPDYESFRSALQEMGFDDAEIDNHSNNCAKSPTILRRQLAKTPSLNKPRWARSTNRLKKIVPFVLAGTWKANQNGDKEIICYLADKKFPEVEKTVAELSSIEDAPIWGEGSYHGIISILEAYHAISGIITRHDLNQFFFVAELVLSEDDPALDLKKDERWAAGTYKKVRNHSGAIHESICDSLIILSIYGNSLFGKRLGIDVSGRVGMIIRGLLKNQPSRVWHSQQDKLPRYAEAAPDVFLDIIEEEINSSSPAFASLFESTDSGIFSKCERTGMLWALELLAWEPSRLPRVACVLGFLSSFDIDDNWVNKPQNSLKDILLSWRPHTAASVKKRCEVLSLLTTRFREIAWNLCSHEIDSGHDTTSGTYRPRWRNDASGAGQIGATYQEMYEYKNYCLTVALNWPNHDLKTLSLLTINILQFSSPDKDKVLLLIEDWLKSSPDETDIIIFREKVRTQLFRRGDNGDEKQFALRNKLLGLLEPKGLINKHQWLFANQWIDYTPEELHAEKLDFDERGRKINEARIKALKLIYKDLGFNGLIEVCDCGDTSFTIGTLLTQSIFSKEDSKRFIISCLKLRNSDLDFKLDNCLAGILQQSQNKNNAYLLIELSKELGFEKENTLPLVRLFKVAPFKMSTWVLLENQNKKVQSGYWKEVVPHSTQLTSNETEYFVKKMLNVNRPRASFNVVRLKPNHLSCNTLIKLLNEVATNSEEPINNMQFSEYDISKCLEILNKNERVSKNELSKLEYLYIDFLTPRSSYGIPNLSRELANSPLFFNQLLAFCFRRKDDGNDPKSWNIPTDQDQRKRAAHSAYSLLENANVIPGTAKNGDNINSDELLNWIVEARAIAKENGRLDIADQQIGKILSKSNIGQDGVWPREEIRKPFDEIASVQISQGMEIGLFNSGGAAFRGPDGNQEREEAAKYREYAEKIINSYPFVGRMLMNICEDYQRRGEWEDTEGKVRKRLRE